MTTCTLIAGIISCVISGPTPTAAESAALLAPRAYVHIPRTYGPTVTIIASDPTHGPYGPVTVSAPTVRLDGTPLSDPPWISVAYGSPFGYGARRGDGRPNRRTHRR